VRAAARPARGALLGARRERRAGERRAREQRDAGAGGEHACATRAQHPLACWGANDHGQLGDGTMGTDRATPVPVGGVETVLAPAAGQLHTCAITTANAVACWGEDMNGQLGDGAPGPDRATPVEVAGLRDALELCAGTDHTCARVADGRVLCWGSNASGQLGDGTTVASATPTPVRGVADATRIACGPQHACALVGAGVVTCWGLNASGQLGDETTASRALARQVHGL
jgi:alpha-tubulin suppressor-like RCC1 family protein